MKFIFLTLLLNYIWLTSVVIAEFLPKSCCLEVSTTKVPVTNLLDYHIQNTPLCHLRAIQFHTRKNITICSDPKDNWAKKAMKEIDARKTTTPPGPMCRTGPSTRIPTTPIKTPGPETIKTPGPGPETIKTPGPGPETIKTPGPGPETIKTPIKTPGPETKTSSRTVTSISTAPSTVTTFKTEGLLTKIRTTSTKPATESRISSQSSLSSTNPCTEPKHSTETSHKPHGKDTEAPQTTFTSTKNRTMRKKPLSKLIQRKRSKSKKQLRKYQTNIVS